MAASIRVTLSSSPSIRTPTSSSASCHQVPSCSLPLNYGLSSRTYAGGRSLLSQGRRAGLIVRSNMDTVAVPVVGQVTEVNKDTFWPLVKGAGDKVVVLDMYTQWCGPCKIIAPKFQQLSEKHLDVVFMKLDCNKENKVLAKELGIKVVPTFKIIKESKIIKEVTGAKFDDLVLAIETVKST